MISMESGEMLQRILRATRWCAILIPLLTLTAFGLGIVTGVLLCRALAT